MQILRSLEKIRIKLNFPRGLYYTPSELGSLGSNSHTAERIAIIVNFAQITPSKWDHSDHRGFVIRKSGAECYYRTGSSQIKFKDSQESCLQGAQLL